MSAALLDAIDALIAQAAEDFSADAARELPEYPSPRVGYEAQIPTLLRAISKTGFVVPELDTDAMVKDAERAARLQPVIAVLRELLARCEANASLSRARSYRTFVRYYGILTKVAPANADVEKTLEPIVEFMAQRTKRVRQPRGAAGSGEYKR